MVHRIRASVVVPNGDRILMVQGYEPEDSLTVAGMTGHYWSIPGGGLENDESVMEGAAREIREETDLEIVAERVIYVHEVIHRLPHESRDQPMRQIELYVLASTYSGEIAISDPDILDVRFLSRDEIATAAAYPPALRDLFWQDLADDFPEMRFLGTHYVG